jgi:DNA polymerase I-like protein with 3'-5' exonuclease and polymerase domains
MSTLVLDVETTISNKGNPFDLTNKLVVTGLRQNNKNYIYYDDYNINHLIQYAINNNSLIVGFNIKFDLHWLRRIGINISKIKVWDCQIAHFLLNNQQTPFPSLNDCAIRYSLAPKLDVVKNEYWDKGIDTDAIPREVLSEYLTQDLVLTQQVYERQLAEFQNNGRFKLFQLHCQDLLVLEEMEYNGILFSTEKALTKAATIEVDLEEIKRQLSIQVGGIPFNPNSNDHISCLLYGGAIIDIVKIPIGVYKTGPKTGLTRYKNIEKIYTLPKLIEPIEGTLVKKSKEHPEKGLYWEVNETVLRKLKFSGEGKKVVKLLNEYAKLEKLKGTYLVGYTELIKTMNWEHNMLHGQFNQCIAITGRLSSSRPNLQNGDPTTKTYMESRYD